MSLSVIIIPVDGNADAAPPPPLPPYVSKIEYYEIEFDNRGIFSVSFSPTLPTPSYNSFLFLPFSNARESSHPLLAAFLLSFNLIA